MKRSKKGNDKAYFILMKSIAQEGNAEYEIHMGTLWVLEERLNPSVLLVCKYEGDNAGILKQIESLYLKELNYEMVHLLLGVPPPLFNRVNIASDIKWIKEGIEINVGSIVEVYDFPGLPPAALGTVRFKGRLPGKNGTSFGIELHEEHAGKGTTNGMFRHKRLFTCNEDCGVFLSILRIRLSNKFDVKNSEQRSAAEGDCVDNINFHDCHQKPDMFEEKTLEKHERVVWMSDFGPEFGTVKWIGILPYSVDNKTVVGVEFDNPVGTGTGKYKGSQLFRAKRNHASLIPLLGLLRASVYMSMMTDNGAISSTPDVDYTDYHIAGDGMRENGDGKQQEDQYLDNLILESQLLTLNGASAGGANNFQNSNQSYDYSSKCISRGPNPNVSVLSLLPAMNSNVNSEKGLFTIDRTPHLNLTIQSSDLNVSGARPKDYSNVNNGIVNSTITNNPKDSGVVMSADAPNDKVQGFVIGDRVTVHFGSERSGEIRWIGTFPKSKSPERIIAGIEMDMTDTKCYTAGTFQGHTVFSCPPGKAFFFPLNKCKKQPRLYYNT